MLLRYRSPGIDSPALNVAKGLEHLEEDWIAVLHWLQSNRIDYVLVGPVAAAIRGDVGTKGPVMIVPAPYGRNLERLSRALWCAHARLRMADTGPDGGGADSSERSQRETRETMAVKLSAEELASATRWTLRCGLYDVDVEARSPGLPCYQELLYEATRFEPASELSVEVASPEDLEHYAMARHGAAPEIRITRNRGTEQD
ncbi:MAG: hypothetical protein ACR2OB_02505 [Solirubrobacteraceae bacterium]